LLQGYEVHAADHQVGEKLQSLRGRLHRIDLRSPNSIAGLAAVLANKPVDLLLNVAGIMFPPEQDSLETTNKNILTATVETNTFGPLLLTQALLPNLLASEAPKVGVVSSRVGSVGDNSTGGSYAYRASKAAVNSIGKSMAMDLKEKGVVVSLLHPGFVKTNLNTGSAEPNPEAVEPEEAATKLWAIVQRVGMDQTGKFWHREGYELPW
jgi:NAD(P)-dependent dehydrogenase (short-subunit alcohol dehydrogenase family)